MSLRDLSAATATSLTTVRRRLQSMLASRLVLRCDLARPLSGWPLSAVYFASVPGQYVEETSRVLSAVREVRSCAITAGPHNLVVDVWLRDLRDVHAFEAHLSRKLPRLTVSDRSVVLRTVKHMGRLLDHDGRCVGLVPLRHPHGPAGDQRSGSLHASPSSEGTRPPGRSGVPSSSGPPKTPRSRSTEPSRNV
jgi:DNA-binding Lrp family transcriptional regulator